MFGRVQRDRAVIRFDREIELTRPFA